MEAKREVGVKWVRRASDVEDKMAKQSEMGIFLVVYILDFCVQRPVQPEEIETALRHLYRKAPNLRVCVAERGKEMWFKELEKETLDFEVWAGSVEEVTEFLHTHPYPLEGPSWRARLVEVSSPSYHPPRLASFHEDLAGTFPHCYHLLFGFSHAIGDGHTFIRICAAFTHILDRVLAGEEVDGAQIGTFDLNEEYDSKVMAVMANLDEDEAFREQCIREAHEGKPQTPVVEHVLSPREGPRKTLLYTQSLDQATTTRLLDKCRAAGVTLSTCLAAVGNLALVDLVAERGVVQDTYSVSNTLVINMRRLWPKGTTEHAFGCYISMSPRRFITTPRGADHEQFWQYAREVHASLYQVLHDQHFLEKAVFVVRCINKREEQHTQCDLNLNTRGDLTQRFQGTKQLTVTNLLSSVHNTNIPWGDLFGTVRGRLSHTVKYNTGLVTQDTATRYGDLVHAWLLKVAAATGVVVPQEVC